MPTLSQLAGETDRIIERDDLVVPAEIMSRWRSHEHVHRFLRSFLEANWSMQAASEWKSTDDYMGNRNRSLADMERDRKSSSFVLVNGTGLHVSGAIEAYSELTCRTHRERAIANQDGQDVHTVGIVKYSIGDENQGLYATTKEYVQHGSGHPGLFRGVRLSGTIVSEVVPDTARINLEEVQTAGAQAVAAFIRREFLD